MKTRGQALVGLCAVVLLATGAPGDITFISNGEMPDLPQVWNGQQKNRAICEAAAAGDIMWYWDQHGYRGLVSLSDPAKPNDKWRQDGQDLVFLLARYIYGKDPMTNAISNLGSGTTLAALGKYIRSKDMYARQKTKGAQGLVVDYYQAGNATYNNWVAGINGGSTLMAGAEWRGPNGQIALHAMTSAGVDSENKLILVTHGWDDHPANLPPYEAPPNPNTSPPYIRQYPIEIAGGRASIPNDGKGTVDLFNGAVYGAAERVAIGSFYSIHPQARARVDMKQKKGNGLNSSYDVTITNDTFDPIFQYIQQVDVPVDSVTPPPGWQAIPWNFLDTPDATALPIQSAQPPFEIDPLEPPELGSLGGILFFTMSNPILPGFSLDGFSFDASDAFSMFAGDSASLVSNGRSLFVDAGTTGLTTELLFPDFIPVPEPATALIGGAGILLLAMRRKHAIAA